MSLLNFIQKWKFYLSEVKLSIIFALFSGDRNIIQILKTKWWIYLLMGLADVEANYTVVKAYQFTTLTSIQVRATQSKCAICSHHHQSWVFSRAKLCIIVALSCVSLNQKWVNKAFIFYQLLNSLLLFWLHITIHNSNCGSSNK